MCSTPRIIVSLIIQIIFFFILFVCLYQCTPSPIYRFVSVLSLFIVLLYIFLYCECPIARFELDVANRARNQSDSFHTLCGISDIQTISKYLTGFYCIQVVFIIFTWLNLTTQQSSLEYTLDYYCSNSSSLLDDIRTIRG